MPNFNSPLQKNLPSVMDNFTKCLLSWTDGIGARFFGTYEVVNIRYIKQMLTNYFTFKLVRKGYNNFN